MPLIPSLGRERQVDFEFKQPWSTVSSRTAAAVIQKSPVSNTAPPITNNKTSNSVNERKLLSLSCFLGGRL